MSKYVDTNAIIQVLGDIFNAPYILDSEDKYKISEDDFPEKFHQLIFAALYKIHQLGAKEITLIDVENFFKGRPKSKVIYDQRKGSEWLAKAAECSAISTFDYYYNRLKKMSLLRAYDNIGVNVKDIYDPDNILDVKKQQAQEEFLDNSSLIDIADIIDKKIVDVRSKYADNTLGKEYQAGDNIRNLIEELKITPEYGFPMYGTYMNTVTRGARLGKFYLRSAASGYGKAIPNDTKIPTPEGWKRVDEIKVGDYLFDALGNPTKVIGVFPQGKKEVWEISFKDGRKAKCCSEHLWSYCTNGQREESKKNRKFFTNTLEEILKTKKLKDKNLSYNILIPNQQAVKYTTKQYKINPYVLGLLLGDGSFRYTSNQKALIYSSENSELPSKIAKIMGYKYKKNSDKNYSYTFEWENNKEHLNVWVEEILKDYPELWNLKSSEKFIPSEFLLGDIEQRFDLLNGLLDTDGSIDKKGRIYFSTSSTKLKDNVIELCRSLGFKTNFIIDTRKENPNYILLIMGSPENKKKLFKLDRKKTLILNWYNNKKRKEKNDFNPIINIQNLGYETEMTCFLVDNPEHLFLMNDFIVTHNSRAMAADACYAACSEMYYDNTGWVEIHSRQPTLLISTELSIEEVQTMFLSFLSNVDEAHILNGYYVGNEEERVLKAAEILEQAPLYVEELLDFSLQDVENVIRKNIRERGVKLVFFDYIHSSLKILEEISSKAKGMPLREDNVLFMMSNKLKNICIEYNVFILSSSQLSNDWRSSETPDQNLLRGKDFLP